MQWVSLVCSIKSVCRRYDWYYIELYDLTNRWRLLNFTQLTNTRARYIALPVNWHCRFVLVPEHETNRVILLTRLDVTIELDLTLEHRVYHLTLQLGLSRSRRRSRSLGLISWTISNLGMPFLAFILFLSHFVWLCCLLIVR